MLKKMNYILKLLVSTGLIQFIGCTDFFTSPSDNLSRDASLVQITDLLPNDLQLDSFNLDTVTINGNILTLAIGHAGGCEKHDYSLYMSGGFYESFSPANPVEANLYLKHNANGDLCEAYLRKEISFDLTPVADLYEATYQRRDKIIVNIYEYFKDNPDRKLSVNYNMRNSEQLFKVKIDSINVPGSISGNDTLTIALWGFIGPDGCHSLSHYEAMKTENQIDLTVWGKFTPADACTEAIVELRGEKFKIPPPYSDPFTIVIHQPNNSILTRKVNIK